MSKLPVLDVLGDVISSTFDNIRYAFAISWPWLAVLFPPRIMTEVYKLFYGFHPIASYNNTQYDWPSLILAIISFFAFSSIAVNWHRFILNGDSAEGWGRLRVDGSVWRYFGFAIAVTVLAYILIMIPSFVLMFLGVALHGFGVFLAIIGGLVVVFAVVGWTARWSIKLVAIALEDRGLSMSDCLAATAGNHWRIIGLYFLLAIVLMLVGLASLLVGFVVAKIGLPLLSLLFAGAELLFNWFATIMGITMLTALYAFFVQKRELA